MDVFSVPVVGTLVGLFPRTSAPLLFVWSSFRSARGVGAARSVTPIVIRSWRVLTSIILVQAYIPRSA
jgi:hypothetical protein